jgi:hypothetical protein
MASTLPLRTFFSGDPTMFGPGEYVPDPTAGIVDSNDLPRPILVPYDAHYDHRPCPRCGHLASRHKCDQRTFHDWGDWRAGRPIALVVTSSSHDCANCRKPCNAALSAVAWPGSHDTRRVIALAGRIVVQDGLPYRPARGHLWRDHRVCVPFGTMQNGVEMGGQKGPRPEGRHLSGLGAGVVCGRCGSRCALRGTRRCGVGRCPARLQTAALCGPRS